MSSIVHSSNVEHYCSKFLLLNCQLNSTKQAFSYALNPRFKTISAQVPLLSRPLTAIRELLVHWLNSWPSLHKTKMTSTTTRPDTRLPQSRAGGQRLYLRSLYHLGRSSEAKNRKNPKKVKCDGRTDGPTKRVVESRSTRLKRNFIG